MTIRAPSPTSTDELDTSSTQRTRPVVADRLCGARSKSRQNLPLRDQGCVLVSDRELLDQQPDAGPIRRRRPPDGRRRTWQRGFLHSAFRSRFGTSNQQIIPCLAARDLVGRWGETARPGQCGHVVVLCVGAEERARRMWCRAAQDQLRITLVT